MHVFQEGWLNQGLTASHEFPAPEPQILERRTEKGKEAWGAGSRDGRAPPGPSLGAGTSVPLTRGPVTRWLFTSFPSNSQTGTRTGKWNWECRHLPC